MDGNKRPGRPPEGRDEKEGSAARSISLPLKLWKLLEEKQKERMDTAISTTIKDLLLKGLGR